MPSLFKTCVGGLCCEEERSPCDALAECLGVAAGIVERDIEFRFSGFPSLACGANSCDTLNTIFVVDGPHDFDVDLLNSACSVRNRTRPLENNIELDGQCFGFLAWRIEILGDTEGELAGKLQIEISLSNLFTNGITYQLTTATIPPALCDGDWVSVPWLSIFGTPPCPHLGTTAQVRLPVIEPEPTLNSRFLISGLGGPNFLTHGLG